MSRHPGRRRLRWRPTPDTAIALLALTLAAGGGGYALAAATTDQTITACVESGTGIPQKIISSGSCDPGLTALSWNQAGPQGPAGSTGSTGTQGPVGPAGKDAATAPETVVALPPKPTLRRKGRFSVSLELPGPGTYQIDGHVAWTTSGLKFDAPVACQISRTQPATVVDKLETKILKDDPFGFSTIDESAVTTVEAPGGSAGQVIAVPVPVKVTFGCTAKLSETVPKVNSRVIFRDWTLGATPVKVYTVQKPK